jgi:hypothetical protein
MEHYAKEDLTETLMMVDSIFGRCERMLGKFPEGSSQHSLLKNRLKALTIAKDLLAKEDNQVVYDEKELTAALESVTSIMAKCESAQQKHPEGSTNFLRFQKIKKAMAIIKTQIAFEISRIDSCAPEE